MRQASSASMTLPVRMSSSALPSPTTRDRRWVPPLPGIIPRETSGRPTLAPSTATRISHASASSQPPPKAKPLMAAITGLLSRAIISVSLISIFACRAATTPTFSWAASLRSLPAENDRSPAPVRITTRTSGSARMAVTASMSSSRIWRLRAFSTSGRFRVRYAMPSLRSNMIAR